MNPTLQDLMREATQLTQAGRLNEATEAIQRALRGTGADAPVAASVVLDGCVFEVETNPPIADAKPQPERGEFISSAFTQSSRTLRYGLYVPPVRADQPLPLVVMLHGCTQSAEDFAAGTGMNERARELGFYVLYPEQAQQANPQRCWNWFKHSHQKRGSGEPALIAGITQAVMAQYRIDPCRVYIAGLSAGGAMAAIVAAAYPELFAAVGVHSGLPRGAAGNVAEALAAMKGAGVGAGLNAGAGTAAIPTIVFHGDQDRTVHPSNGERVIAAALHHSGGPTHAHTAAGAEVERGRSANGRHYTRATHRGEQGHALAEHWVVHGAGHAWSGGHASGSYTDAQGPDATGEMLRFFFEHPRAPRH